MFEMGSQTLCSLYEDGIVDIKIGACYQFLQLFAMHGTCIIRDVVRCGIKGMVRRGRGIMNFIIVNLYGYIHTFHSGTYTFSEGEGPAPPITHSLNVVHQGEWEIPRLHP